jgi:hypothetical protein
MKKNLLLIVAFVAVLTFVNTRAGAQTVSTGTVTATIKIADVYAIVVNDAAVQIDYLQQSDFVDNRTAVKANQITVFSNRKYKIDVKATENFRVGSATTNVINQNVMQVSVTAPASPPGSATYTTQFLGATNANIINNAPAALAQQYSMTYTIPTVASILGTPAGTYTTDITYTLTQQ